DGLWRPDRASLFPRNYLFGDEPGNSSPPPYWRRPHSPRRLREGNIHIWSGHRRAQQTDVVLGANDPERHDRYANQSCRRASDLLLQTSCFRPPASGSLRSTTMARLLAPRTGLHQATATVRRASGTRTSGHRAHPMARLVPWATSLRAL